MDDILVGTGFPATLSTHTIVAVLIRRGTVGAGGFWSYNSAATNNGWRYDTNGVGAVTMTFGGVAAYNVTVGNWGTGVTNLLTSVVTDAGAFAPTANGSAGIPAAVGSMVGSPTRLSLFGYEGGSFTYANIDVGEFLLFDSTLSAGDVALLTTHLKAKWGTP